MTCALTPKVLLGTSSRTRMGHGGPRRRAQKQTRSTGGTQWLKQSGGWGRGEELGDPGLNPTLPTRRTWAVHPHGGPALRGWEKRLARDEKSEGSEERRPPNGYRTAWLHVQVHHWQGISSLC